MKEHWPIYTYSEMENINIVLHKVHHTKQQRKKTNSFEPSVWLQNCWQLCYWIQSRVMRTMWKLKFSCVLFCWNIINV